MSFKKLLESCTHELVSIRMCWDFPFILIIMKSNVIGCGVIAIFPISESKLEGAKMPHHTLPFIL